MIRGSRNSAVHTMEYVMTTKECKATYILLVLCICHFNILFTGTGVIQGICYSGAPGAPSTTSHSNIIHLEHFPLCRKSSAPMHVDFDLTRNTYLLRMHIYSFYNIIECIDVHIIISDIALYIEMGYPFNLKLCDLLIQAHE